MLAQHFLDPPDQLVRPLGGISIGRLETEWKPPLCHPDELETGQGNKRGEPGTLAQGPPPSLGELSYTNLRAELKKPIYSHSSRPSSLPAQT